MAKFSANLGFLWRELEPPDAIRAAAKAGFDAVEFHVPSADTIDAVKQALAETGLPMLGLNTAGADNAEFGLTAIPERRDEARQAIDAALAYATAVGATHVHALAGKATGDEADRTYAENLSYAAQAAAKHGINVLIEPLNQRDAPDYYLGRVEQAVDIIDAIGEPNLKLMFDCYHVQIMQGDLIKRIESTLSYIGHIQIASVPDRHEPDQGEIAYERLVPVLDQIGYEGYIGAEYVPRHGTEEGLCWLRWFGR